MKPSRDESFHSPFEFVERRLSPERRDGGEPGKTVGVRLHEAGAYIVPSPALFEGGNRVCRQHGQVYTRGIHEFQV